MSVAKPLPHDAAPLHVTGAARYVDDIPTPPGTLHLAFGQSPVPAGRLNGVNLDAVRAAPGVVDILTAADLPGANNVSPSPEPEPFLAVDRVEFVGQPIFVVIAHSHHQARAAARLATFDIKKTKPILSIQDALMADSSFGDPVVWSRGEARSAISASPHMVRGELNLGGQEHFYLEGQAALAQPQEGGDMVVSSSTQHPSEVQEKVAEALGTHMHAVRVEVRRMGGGFGGKESQGNALAVACALAAARTGKTCKMRYDRDDDMVITGKRHEFRIRYEVGFDDDGRLLGVEFEHDVRCGWSLDLSHPVCDRAMLHADNAYFLPAVQITSHRWKTNTQSATAFRGFGGPQGLMGIERVMDHVAHALGKDPLEVRRANFYAETGQETHYGMPVTDAIIADLVEDLASRSDYARRRGAVARWNKENPILKKGIALTPVKFGISFTLTQLNQAGALVHVYHDGSIHLNHGGTEMGQGLFQKVAQVAAEAFGQPMEAVKITATDTGKVPNTSATAASSGSDLNGMAVKHACDTITARLADFLGREHQCPPDKVRFADGAVSVDGQELSFHDVIHRAYAARVPLSATGFYATPEIEWDRMAGKGRPFFYFAYGAAVSEVVIDTLTGENRILRADILHDVGRSLNPALDIGQVEGGYVQGAGWLTTEELVWDDEGRLNTHAPSTYKIPACSDRPRIFNVDLYDNENRSETIYRSKAVGEPPLMLGASVLMALSDAVAACGPEFGDLDAPATAEAVLAAVERARGE